MTDTETLRKVATCIHIAVEQPVAEEVSKHIMWAVGEIELLEATNEAFLKRLIQRDADQGRALLEIDRLRTALEPFANVGAKFKDVAKSGAIPAGASARFMKLEPLVAQDFLNAAKALDK